jgi:hypothetical protein
MPGQVFLIVSHQVASSFGTVPDAAGAETGAEPAGAEAAGEEAATAGEDAATAGEDAATAGALEVPALDVEPLLELLQADMISASAPIPAMVAIALLADVRDTRPTSVSWGKVDVRVLTTGLMKAFSTPLCKPRLVIRS